MKVRFQDDRITRLTQDDIFPQRGHSAFSPHPFLCVLCALRGLFLPQRAQRVLHRIPSPCSLCSPWFVQRKAAISRKDTIPTAVTARSVHPISPCALCAPWFIFYSTLSIERQYILQTSTTQITIRATKYLHPNPQIDGSNNFPDLIVQQVTIEKETFL